MIFFRCLKMTQPTIEKIDVDQIGDKKSYLFSDSQNQANCNYSKSNYFRRISLEQ